MSASTNWAEAQSWEQSWWGDCLNTFHEEEKQYVYAHYMGLNKYRSDYYGRSGWDFGQQAVLDVGCGPVSILLKSKARRKFGVDPCAYPEWVDARYAAANVYLGRIPGEDLNFGDRQLDIGLIYNCLQHTQQPQIILDKMRRMCKVIHIFEWIDTGISDGHLHDLTEEKLNGWLSGEGRVLDLNQNGCVGKAYAGIFPGL